MNSNEINDGGPAFPRSRVQYEKSPSQKGMTLRDWFAGLAMQGMNASPELLQVVTSGDIKDGTAWDRLSKAAYGQADAMLKVRNQEPGNE